jgi:YHS domain-containing protein
MNPKPGSPLCPITSTRADTRFRWNVGGKAYLFCCPPCIDEFVQRAKDEPTSIRRPEDYVQR